MTRRAGALALLLGAFFLAACSDDPTAPDRAEDVTWAPSLGIDLADFDGGAGEVRVRVDEAGTGGDPAGTGDALSVRYTGWLADGTEFDANEGQGRPLLEFTLGAGQLIPGFEAGVRGMVTGEVRTVLIPPALGYGSRGAGAAVPPDAWLVFRIRRV